MHPGHLDGGWHIGDGETLIGRGIEAPVCIPHKSVSRIHARVVGRQGQYFIEDLDSTNGTFLNTARVTKPIRIGDGDRLAIGDIELEATFAADVSQEEHGPTLGDQSLIYATALMAVREESAGTFAEEAEASGEQTVLVPAELAIATHTEADSGVESQPPPAEETTEAGAGATMLPQVVPEHAPAMPFASLSRLAAMGESLAAQLSAMQHDIELGTALFESVGGRDALIAVLGQAQRTQAQSMDLRELLALAQHAPTIIALLQSELLLIDALAPAAPRSFDGEEIQSDRTDDQPIA